MRRALGWAFAIAVASATGCGSSKGPSNADAAGTSGHGGTSGAGGAAGTSGAAGTGGAAAGTAGTGSAGSGGAGGGRFVGCPDGTVTPASPTIADFTDAGAPIQFMGGITTFGVPSPEVTLTGGNLHALVTVASGPDPLSLGFGIYFRHCIDAGAYRGVKFDMSGTVDGCAMSYAVNFSEDAWNPSLVDAGTGGDSNGACTLGPTACFPPTKIITATSQTILFSEVSGGAPAHAVDKNHLTGMGWQFDIAARPDGGPSSACIVDVTIDNLVFVP